MGELQTRHRLCLSGTPMENHLGEIWSLFHFLTVSEALSSKGLARSQITVLDALLLALQKHKAALADNMYSGAAVRKQPLFTESDLAALLRPLSAG